MLTTSQLFEQWRKEGSVPVEVCKQHDYNHTQRFGDWWEKCKEPCLDVVVCLKMQVTTGALQVRTLSIDPVNLDAVLCWCPEAVLVLTEAEAAGLLRLIASVEAASDNTIYRLAVLSWLRLDLRKRNAFRAVWLRSLLFQLESGDPAWSLWMSKFSERRR